jgi:hypothetical protein
MINGNACFAYFNKSWGIPPNDCAYKFSHDARHRNSFHSPPAGMTGDPAALAAASAAKAGFRRCRSMVWSIATA